MQFDIMCIFFVQLLVEACDSGRPRKCVNTTVTVNINRIIPRPVCASSNFANTIDENAKSGSTVLQINAQTTGTSSVGSLNSVCLLAQLLLLL